MVSQIDNAIVVVVVVLLWVGIAAVASLASTLIVSHGNLDVRHYIFLDIMDAVQVRIE